MQIRTDLAYFKDILTAIERVESFLNEVSKDQFFDTIEKQSVVIRETTVIGEPANRVNTNLYNDYDLKDLIASVKIRHVLAHDYYEIDLDLVWEKAHQFLPKVKKTVNTIIRERFTHA